MNRKTIIVAVAALILTAGILYLILGKEEMDESVLSENVTKEPVMTAEVTTLPVKEEPVMVCVFVCGCVKTPGVYEVTEDARVVDAITKAGGFSENAAKDYLNLARHVTDGEQLYVPAKEEVTKENPCESFTGEEGSLSKIVNINTAEKEQLMTLPGIGEVRADDIIDYRNEKGPFLSPEDIMNVTGIKESAFRKIKEYITVN